MLRNLFQVENGADLSKLADSVCSALVDAGLYFTDVHANALVVKNCERYFKTANSVDSWNLRDEHMFSVLENKMMSGARIIVRFFLLVSKIHFLKRFGLTILTFWIFVQ